MILSIIIPVYNVKEYLGRCIDSALKQDIDDYEVLLIDDGSTDGSSQICDEYAKRNSIIRVFHKKNGGLSDTRNYGLKRAKGTYITFLDSDDFVIENAYKIFLNKALEKNTDIVIGNKVRYTSDNKIVNLIKKREYTNKVYSGKEFLVTSVKNRTMSMASVLSIYKKELILQNSLFFEENLLHEDELWTPQVFLKAKRVVYMDIDFYMHYQREGSITQKKDKTSNAINLIDICYKLDKIFSDIEGEMERKILKDYLSMLYLNAFLVGKLYRKKYRQILSKRFLISNSYSLRNKLKTIIFCINKKLYFHLNIVSKKISKTLSDYYA